MLESYFNKYDQAIAPRKRSIQKRSVKRENIKTQQGEFNSTLPSTMSREKQKSPIGTIPNENEKLNNNNILTTHNFNIGSSTNELKGLYFMERKINLELRHENAGLKEQIINLQQIINDKDITIKKMKNESDKDTAYLLNLEKLVTSLQSKLRNKKQMSQEFNSNSMKKKISTDNINNEQIINPNKKYNALNEEINKLKEFKAKILSLSKENEVVNLNILSSLKKIEELFFNIDQSYKEKNINIPLHNEFYQMKYSTLTEIKENYDKILSSVMEGIQKKHEEYAYLLNIKEQENELLVKEIEKLKKEKDNVINENTEKNNIINKLRSENQFIKMRDFYKIDEEQRKNLNNQRKNSELSNGRNSKSRIKEMKSTVNRSVGRMKRNFDMTDPGNIEFIDNINCQLE